jgi:hypothetical protein
MSCSSRSSSDIIVKQKIEKNIMDRYDTVIIYVKNDNYKSSDNFRVGSSEISVKAELTKVLKKIGISKVYDIEETSLKVECHFSHGWGLPRFMRHFKISVKYITPINIKFIDLSSNEVIGEVVYKKPLFQTDQKNIISNLINAMIQKEKAG